MTPENYENRVAVLEAELATEKVNHLMAVSRYRKELQEVRASHLQVITNLTEHYEKMLSECKCGVKGAF